MKKEAIGIVATLIFAAATLHVMTVWHENRHAQILNQHNCHSIEIEYKYFDKDPALAKTTADCFGPHGGEQHDKLHETQKLLWPAWLTTVLFFEVSFIRFLYSRHEVKNHH